jgi:hypothetical protein
MSKQSPVGPENPPHPPSELANRANPSPGKLTSPQSVWNSVLARFSKRQIVLAIAIAAISDLACAFLVFAPPLVWGIDVVTALLLFAILGWHWIYLPGLVLEAIPGFGIFPFWLVVVAAVFVLGSPRPKLPNKG